MGKIWLRIRSVLTGKFESPDALKPSRDGKVKSMYVEAVDKKDPKKKG